LKTNHLATLDKNDLQTFLALMFADLSSLSLEVGVARWACLGVGGRARESATHAFWNPFRRQDEKKIKNFWRKKMKNGKK
jgi:hypothetical protein